MKPVVFRGDALDALRAFPQIARRMAGYQIDRVQRGLDPDDWKPMRVVGPGVREIRVRDGAGAFRVLYVAQFAEVVYVLHCFRKQGRKTSPLDVELGKKRFKDLLKGMR